MYCLLVDRIQAERQTVATLIAGGHDLEMPSLYDLDMWLGFIEGPQMDPEQAELRQAVGLSV